VKDKKKECSRETCLRAEKRVGVGRFHKAGKDSREEARRGVSNQGFLRNTGGDGKGEVRPGIVGRKNHRKSGGGVSGIADLVTKKTEREIHPIEVTKRRLGEGRWSKNVFWCWGALQRNPGKVVEFLREGFLKKW